MGVATAAVGAVFSVLGFAGLAAPNWMSKSLDRFKSSPRKIYGWAGVRVLMGLILMIGASDTAFPTLIRFVGAVVVFKAALVPFLGLDQVRSIIDWFQDRPPLLIRFLFLLVVSFGAFLVWAGLQP